jgi:hypothetical protein
LRVAARAQRRTGALGADRRSRNVQKFVRGLSCTAVVEVEHSTEPLATLDDPVIVSSSRMPTDESIAQPLMIEFPAIMLHEFRHRTAKRRLPDEYQTIQALFL